MYNKWTVDLSDSVRALESIKKSVLPKLIRGKIYTIENIDNYILMKIDTKSGIDYMREDDKGLQGIAARVQWGNSWNTFTIRSARHTGSKTELEKRLYQIENGYFYPAFTLQAYFNNRKENKIKSISIIKTVDLYKLYKNKNYIFESRSSDNEFVFVRWSKIKKYIKTYYND